jgi:hypothetical protein
MHIDRLRLPVSAAVFMTAAVFVSGCPAPLDTLAVPEGCNPLAADLDCLLPYPSDVFLVDDASLPSGRRVEHGEAARPRSESGAPVDPTLVHPADGFAHLPQALALFGVAIDDSNLPDVNAPERSLEPGSPTVILNADTGERVLHLAELDPRTDDPTRQALNVRPLIRLESETRYVIAIRDLVGPGGAPVPTPEGFRRIRDGIPGADPRETEAHVLDALAARYETEIFPLLEAAGIARGALQLAWDFTTGSHAHATADLLAIRDAIIAHFEATAPPVTITAVEDDPDHPDLYRRVRGHLTVPLFLEANEASAPITRGSDGRPVQNGTTSAHFTILIPHSVWDGDAPARFLQYGHGFFGGRGEIEGSFVRTFANRTGMVVGAVDWIGMAADDRSPVGATLLAEPSATLMFTDRVHQSMAHQIALTYAARSSLLEETSLQRADGTPFFDPDALYFYGISQGHILGGTYVALSPHIERAVFSVGGASYPLMMMRARPFIEFLQILEIIHDDPLDHQKFVSLTATTFDRIDPVMYAPHVTEDLLPNSPAERRILMHVGIGDPLVANVASHVHARSMGLSLLTPAPRSVAGLSEVTAPFDGSAMVELDFGLDEPVPGTYATPADENNVVHEGVRRTEPSILQVDAFFEPGAPIAHFCDGACTPD